MADGWQALGDVLGGGVEAARVNAFQQGQYRRAQTEDALAAARKGQAEAMKAERQNMDAQWLIDHADELNYTDPSSALVSRIISGGMGGDYSSAMTGTKTGQDIRFRNTAADPTVGAEQRTRTLGALHGQPYADLVPVGSSGYTDITSDDPTVTAVPRAPGGFGGGIPSWKVAYDNWVAQGGTPSNEALEWFYRNNQLTTAGGVPYATRTSPDAPLAPQSAPAVAPDQVAANTDAQAQARTAGAIRAKARAAAPATMERFATLNDTVNKLVNSAGFHQIYGVRGAIDPAQLVPGSDYSVANVLRKAVADQSFLVAFDSVRGAGPVSDREGEAARNALIYALDPDLSEEEARAAFTYFQTRLNRFQNALAQEIGTGHSGAAPSAPPAQTTPLTFNTEEEAAAAGLLPGTRVIINGVSGVWE